MTYLTYLRIINNKKYDYGYLYHIKDKESNLLGFLKSKKNSGLKEGTYDIILSNTPKDFNNLLHQLSTKYSKGIPSVKIEHDNQKADTIPIMYANKELLVSRNTILYSGRAYANDNGLNLENKELYHKLYDIIQQDEDVVLTIQDVDLILTIKEEHTIEKETKEEREEIESLLNEVISPAYDTPENETPAKSKKKSKKKSKEKETLDD